MNNNKYRFYIISLFCLLAGCQVKSVTGKYYNSYDLHSGSLFILNLKDDSTFIVEQGTKDLFQGIWRRKGRKLFLYSPSFKHSKPISNKPFEYYYNITKDTITALNQWIDNQSPRCPKSVDNKR